MVKKGEGRERALGGGVYPTAGTSAASRVVSLSGAWQAVILEGIGLGTGSDWAGSAGHRGHSPVSLKSEHHTITIPQKTTNYFVAVSEPNSLFCKVWLSSGLCSHRRHGSLRSPPQTYPEPLTVLNTNCRRGQSPPVQDVLAVAFAQRRPLRTRGQRVGLGLEAAWAGAGHLWGPRG